MNKTQLLATLKSLGFHPSKKLGQNFLVDENLLDFIVRETAVSSGEIILEVGPGFGALTRKLLAAGARVYAVEYDNRLCEYLHNNIKDNNFHLLAGDACKVDFATQLPRDKDFRCIANLPYAVSSVFIARLLTLAKRPREMFFMLQKEMAQRLGANIGTKNYGSLSVRAQLLYEVKIVRNIPPQVFCPPPEVDSALLKAVLLDSVPGKDELAAVDKILRCVFAQRRKKMSGSLKKIFRAEKTAEAFALANLNDNARPEELSPSDFLRLARTISS